MTEERKVALGSNVSSGRKRSGLFARMQSRLILYAPAIVVSVPFLALVCSPWMLYHFGIRTLDLVAVVLGHFLTIGGITLGYHRSLAHKGVELSTVTRSIALVLAAMAGQGPPSFWVAHHRAHHGDPDGPEDPHSPWPSGTPRKLTARTFFHAHVGWMVSMDLPDPRLSRDLRKDPVIAWVDRHYFASLIASLVLPALLVNAFHPSMRAFWQSLYWTGLVRVAITHQATWMVNSVCHLWGYRNYDTHDLSRNNWMVAVLTLGEGWHNNHHSDQHCPRHGRRFWEFDPTFVAIRFLIWCGLAKYRGA